ncbi:LOW QUALITY PROTEIN: Olfactory receptor 1P1, partial [Galemys pyrenaicus]
RMSHSSIILSGIHLEKCGASQLNFFSHFRVMEIGNQTSSFEFLLWGLSERPEQQGALFLLFLCIYLVTVTGNLLIILAIATDTHLHTPMYFFLASLSCADILFVSTTVPKALVNIQTQSRSMSYAGCLSQLYFFLTFGDMDIFLLATMAYDRYVAICHPLHYRMIMSPRRCTLLITACWTLTNLKIILDFYCDLGPLMKVSCSDTQVNELVMLFLGGTVILIPCILILISYVPIPFLSSPLPRGRKAFSTCGSHLAVVALFFGTVIRAYLCPSSSSSNSVEKNTAAAVMYTVVTPLLNPFIYSLRNKDMKEALGSLLRGKISFMKGHLHQGSFCAFEVMAEGNQTSSFEFLLWGLSERPEQQRILFLVFLWMYLVTVAGNLLIILAIATDSHIHTPMYFFLASLSCADIIFVSTTVPKALVNIQTQSRSMSYAGCLSQLYFFLTFGDMDSFLLATMAYDRYVAICHPLHYRMIMSPRRCTLLITACWTLTNLVAMIQTLLILRLSFCSNRIIPDFYCDLKPLIKLSCSDTKVNELALLLLGGTAILVPFILILVSYVRIVTAILRLPSAQGRRKAFSTCGSHLAVVVLFFGTVIRAYLCPSSSSSNSVEKNTAAAVMYTVVTPLLNPFIYSLRNKDMKVALGKLLRGKVSFLRAH